MGVLDKFLDAIKLNDDYDDDGFLDDDLLEGEDDEDFLDDDFEDKPKKKFFDKFTKKKDSSEDEDFDDFDEKPLKSESRQTASLKQPTASAAAKDPAGKVTLYYALDAGLGGELKYQMEPLRNLYEGIFTKTFTLFYGETLHYYFKAELGEKTWQTQERVITMDKVEGIPVSKYQLINQMLSARRLDNSQEVMTQLKKYLRQEQYVKSMFSIEKESGK